MFSYGSGAEMECEIEMESNLSYHPVLRTSKTAYVVDVSTQTGADESCHPPSIPLKSSQLHSTQTESEAASAITAASDISCIQSDRTPIYKPRNRKRKHTPRKITQYIQNEGVEGDDVGNAVSRDSDSTLSHRPDVLIGRAVNNLMGLTALCQEVAGGTTFACGQGGIKSEAASPYNDRLVSADASYTFSTTNSSDSQSPIGIHPACQQQIEEEHSRGRFKCLLCNYANNHKIALDLHSVVHEGPAPYSCKRCLFVTEEVADLNLHVKQHTGEQRFHCTHPGCEYSSNNSSNLKRHSRSHKDMSILIADEMDSHIQSDDSSTDITSIQDASRARYTDTQQSSSRSLLGQLASVVNGINTTRFSVIAENLPETVQTNVEVLQCDQCEYHTTNPTNLRRHKIKHRAHPSHRCTVCSYTTNYLGNMRRHFEVRHKGIPFDKSLTESPQPKLVIPEMLSSLKTLDWLTAANAIKRSAMEESSQMLVNPITGSKQQRLEDIPDLKPFIGRLPLSREDNSSSLALLQQMVLQHHT